MPANQDSRPDGQCPVYVRTSTLAEMLGCNPKTINRLAERGLIPAPLDLGGLRRWDLAQVLAAMRPQ